MQVALTPASPTLPAHAFVNEWCVPADTSVAEESEVERMVSWCQMVPAPKCAQAE